MASGKQQYLHKVELIVARQADHAVDQQGRPLKQLQYPLEYGKSAHQGEPQFKQ